MPSDAHPEAGTIAAGAADDPVPGWVQAAAAGDAQAWERLVDRYAGLVWSVCRAHRMSAEDAADVSQLTWLRLLENLDQIRDPQRLAGWLATTCRRECLAYLRRARPSTPVEEEHLNRLLGGGAAADRSILEADQNATLWQAFLRLSEWCQPPLPHGSGSASLPIARPSAKLCRPIPIAIIIGRSLNRARPARPARSSAADAAPGPHGRAARRATHRSK